MSILNKLKSKIISTIVQDTYSRCKYCGKTESEVSSLKKGAGIAICNHCIKELYDKLDETEKVIFYPSICCFCGVNKADITPLITDNKVAVCCYCIETGAVSLIKEGFPMDNIALKENIAGCHNKICKDDVLNLLKDVSDSYLELNAVKLATTLSSNLEVLNENTDDSKFNHLHKSRRDFTNDITITAKLMSKYESYKVILTKIISESDHYWEIECSVEYSLKGVGGQITNKNSSIKLILVIENGFIVVLSIAYLE